jgi:cell division protease FtsH
VTYSEFISTMEADRLQEVEVRPDEILGTLRAEAGKRGETVVADRIPNMDERVLLETMKQHKVNVTGHPERASWVGPFLWSVLPLLALPFLFWGLSAMASGTAARGRPMIFGRSKAKLHDRSPENSVTFADVAGVDEAKAELKEIVRFLKEPGKYRAVGARVPKGVLLVGAPGTGKTLLARAVAGESGVPFFSMSGSEFVEMFVGVGASRVRDLFELAKERAPCIIFIDELDAVGKSRSGAQGFVANEEREQTLNQLLVEMDGFDSGSGLVIMAATNRPEILDRALLRAGRFDRQVLVDRPDVRGREAILKVHVKKVQLGAGADLKTIAQRTPGMVGADLANVVNEAALASVRRGSHLERATEMARHMVCRFGMSDKLGPLTFGATGAPRLSSWTPEFGGPRNYSEETLRLIDAEVKAVVATEHERAREHLSRQRETLEAVARELLVHETLQRADFETIVQGAKQPQLRSTPNPTIAAA